jgi:hypothetical protein
VYENARRNGASHTAALDAMKTGSFRCWCGKRDDRVCSGGAQRFVGCGLSSNPKAQLRAITTQVRQWPRFLRTKEAGE